MSEDWLTPYAQTVAEWRRRPRARSLAWLEEQHKVNGGFVFATPAFYVIGRPVVRSAPREMILNPAHVFDFAECDTWFIAQMTGEARQAWQILPWRLPWIAFVRDNDPEEEIRFYEMARLMRLSGV